MQEDQTVTFQPTGLWIHHPWFVNLFVFYVLFVLLLMVVRAASLISALWKHRKSQGQSLSVKSASQSFWGNCNAKVRSIRDFSHLTFLLALLVLVWGVTDVLEAFYTQKTSGFVAVAAGIADTLVTFSFGIVACAALFSCAMFLDRLVLRRMLMPDQKSSKSAFPPE